MQRQSTGKLELSEKEVTALAAAMTKFNEAVVGMQRGASNSDIASDFSRAGRTLIEGAEDSKLLKSLGKLCSTIASDHYEEHARQLADGKEHEYRHLDDISFAHESAAEDAEIVGLPALSKVYYARAFNAAKMYVFNELKEGNLFFTTRWSEPQNKGMDRLHEIASHVLDADGITKLDNQILNQILSVADQMANTSEKDRDRRNTGYYNAINLYAEGREVVRNYLHDEKKEKEILLLQAHAEVAYSFFFTEWKPVTLQTRSIAADYAEKAAEHYRELGAEHKGEMVRMAERAGSLCEELGDQLAKHFDSESYRSFGSAVKSYDRALRMYKNFGLREKAKELASSDKYLEEK